ncbi:MAG: hypothetical protein VKM17_02900 [Cyanobacteriota bacterium]|nr:hypothetical protein [Cyanobacteriota bacterium]
MKPFRSLFLLLLVIGWLGSQGLAPSPVLACDSSSETPSKGKPKGK